MDVNSITYFLGGTAQNNIAALTHAIAGTTETAFSINPNPVNTSLGGGPAALLIPQGVFGSGKPFKLEAFGTITTGTTTNVTLKLYQGVSSTLGSDTAVYAPAAVAVNSTSQNFEFEATLWWDATSQRINGFAQLQIAGTLTGPTAVTAVTAIASDASLSFLLSGTFSAGNAANVIQIAEFSAKVV